MGLEVGTFIDDLVTSNPIGAADDMNKGDDHLRLIKAVLKATFPNATKAFRFESVLTKTTAYPVVAADARTLILGDASGGAFVITLPLGSTVFAGYAIIIMKSDFKNFLDIRITLPCKIAKIPTKPKIRFCCTISEPILVPNTMLEAIKGSIFPLTISKLATKCVVISGKLVPMEITVSPIKI